MAGGGTGGHVIPLLAVADVLRSRGHQALFIGTRAGLESRLAPAHGFDIEYIKIGGLNRVGAAQALKTLAQLPSSVLQARAILRSRHASAVFSLGGYVAAPVVLAAASLRLPVVAMEPNAMPGMVTRRLARFVARALVHFDEARRFFPSGRSELCGLPVREEFFSLPPKQNGPFTVLITGGSRGSRTLNRAAVEAFPLFRSVSGSVRLIVQTGEPENAAVARAFTDSGLQGEVTAFINDMPEAYAQADLIVSRSGAGAVSELAAAGKPSILVPFPFAADDHQRHNAEAMVRAGAARLILDADMNGPSLFEAVDAIRTAPDTLSRMAAAARSAARPGAARRAADVLEELAQSR